MVRRLHLVIFGVALLIRIAHVTDLYGNPFFNHPVIDAAEYDEWARAIRAGDILSHTKGAFWQAPLYSYFLAAIYFLAGGSFLAARLVQACLGAASAMLVYLVARRAMDAHVAAIAGFGAALYWPLVYFDAELLPVILVVFLDLLAVYYLLRAADEGRLRLWVLAGLAMGLGAITRATSLLMVPLVFAWMWTLRNELGRRTVLRAMAAILLVVAIPVGIVTWRNFAIGGEPSLVASSGGLNFYIGNNADYDATVAIRPGARWSALLLEGPTHVGVTEIERSNYFTRKALAWMARNPADTIALYAKKTYLFWNRHEIRRNQDPYFFRQYSHFLGAPLLGFAAVGPLAILGLVVARKPWNRVLLLHLMLLGHFVGVIAFFVCERYRLPAVPYLLIFGAAALLWLVHAARSRRWRSSAAGMAVWVLALSVTLSDVYGTAHPEFSREYYELGLLDEKGGRFADAEAHYREAIAADPKDPDFRVHLAIAHMGRGDYAAAEAELAQALAIMPNCGDAYYLLGGIYQDRRDFARAENAYRMAMTLSPMGANAEAFARLGAVLFEQGKDGDAAVAAREALARDPRHPEARLLAALIAERGGRREEAIAQVRGVLRDLPDHRAGRIILERLTATPQEPRS
jgi:tetratricopeptide (TPR) repeat protein